MSVRELLRARGLTPKRSFGQNFLVADGVIGAIARAAVPMEGATVVELGAGTGALTAALVMRARRTVAIERDRDLIPILEARFVEEIAGGRLSIVEADAAKAELGALLGGADGPRVLCGNLPYQITGRLLSLATRHVSCIDRALFTVQLEVALRLVATPGSKDYGALSVFTGAAFVASIDRRIPPSAFFPAPEVTSAVVVLEPRRPPVEETPAFQLVVKRAFATRRKTLRNAWRGLHVDLEAIAAQEGISLDARGETLDVDAFARFAAALSRPA